MSTYLILRTIFLTDHQIRKTNFINVILKFKFKSLFCKNVSNFWQFCLKLAVWIFFLLSHHEITQRFVHWLLPCLRWLTSHKVDGIVNMHSIKSDKARVTIKTFLAVLILLRPRTAVTVRETFYEKRTKKAP